MAKWTKKQIAAGFGGKAARTRAANDNKRKRSSAKSPPKKARKTITPKKKRTPTMAKSTKKRKGSGKGKSVRRRHGGGGGALGLTSKETQIALGTAALYGTLQAKAIESGEAGKTDMDWFRKAPTITSIGRAATYALVFYLLHRQGIGRGWTKPIAIGLAAVALVQFARNGFKMYTADFKDSALTGDGDELPGGVNSGQTHLAGRIPIDAEYEEQAAYAEAA